MLLAARCYGQASPPVDTTRIRELFATGQWEQVVAAIPAGPVGNADLYYYAGVALAQLGRLDESCTRLLEGRRQSPDDARFPAELAGIAFKQKDYPDAARWLRRTLQIAPRDAYANDFLGTIYFLGGNVEAALKYWNRVDKPQIANVQVESGLRVKPELVDRAFAFSPAAEMRLDDLETSEARVTALGIFRSHRFQLSALDNGKFDVKFQAQERNGWGENRWLALLSAFRGVFYQTIYPEYFNLNGSATNFTSMLRWDAEKRRFAATVSAPLRGNPKYRYSFNVDLRNENWDIRNSFQGPAPLLGSLNLRKELAAIDFTSINSGRWTWSTGLELSNRDYRNVFPGSTLTSNLLLEGFQLKALAGTRYEIVHLPEQRLTTSLEGTAQIARIWSSPSEIFGKVQASFDSRWFPKFQGDDYELNTRVSGGAIAGDFPFDELFMLGLERDNDLLLRAHIGTRDGRKGSAPLGRRYFLSNAEVNKNVYSNGLLAIRLAPFLDIGKTTDPSSGLGVHKWLWDTGAQVKARILGVGFTVTYGKDLRSGNNAFYLSAAR